MHPERHPYGLRGALSALLLAGTLACALPCAAFDLQGHRGARGLAPENTLAGLATALRIGVSTLEFDTGVSADGVLVLAHDPRLNPDFTRDAAGRWLEPPTPALHTLPLKALQAYNVGRLRPGTRYAETFSAQLPADGERMPTLDQVFEQVRRWGATQVRFNIESKISPLAPELAPSPERFAELLVQAVRRHGLAARVTLQSFDWRTLLAARALAPEIETVALTVQGPSLDNLADGRWTAGLRLQDHAGSVPRLVRAAGARTWSPQHQTLTRQTLQEAQALGLRVVPWTVNQSADIERLLDWGVDGLISDYPDRVRAALERRGLPLPPALTLPN